MGWEMRAGGSGPYYTRSRKVHGRVVREYVGGGAIGQLAEALDKAARDARAAQREETKAKREQDRAADPVLQQMSDIIDALTARTLVHAGYHKHRGEWRRRRG